MLHRSLTALALASLVVLGACGEDDDVTGIGTNTATVRFVNATNTHISVAQNGTVGAGNSGLGFGSGSTCLTVNSTTPSLTFTNSTSGTTITGFTPNLAAGGNYTVVAFTGANGTTQFATLNNSFTSTSGQSGLRVFNAASGSGNVVLLSNGAVLNSGVTTSFGNSGVFFSTPAGAQTFTFNTGTGTPVFGSSGAVTLIPGQNNTVILGPAAAGSTALRSFVSTAC